MLFKLVFLFSLLLASAVLALSSSQYDACEDHHREGTQSQVNNRLKQPASASTSNIVYSVNWAGALWNEPNGTFTSVTGTFTVPTPSGGDGATASVWVGIDGDTCTSSILQTGVDLILSDGHASYDAWYEWYPDSTYDFTGINISAGDIVKLSVIASSTTSGTAIVENLTTSQTVSKSLTSTSALCRQSAEWIVEDFAQSGGLAPFANFGTVTFTNAEAATTGNGTYTPSGATVLNIEQNNQTLTSVSVSGSSVTIKHV